MVYPMKWNLILEILSFYPYFNSLFLYWSNSYSYTFLYTNCPFSLSSYVMSTHFLFCACFFFTARHQQNTSFYNNILVWSYLFFWFLLVFRWHISSLWSEVKFSRDGSCWFRRLIIAIPLVLVVYWGVDPLQWRSLQFSTMSNYPPLITLFLPFYYEDLDYTREKKLDTISSRFLASRPFCEIFFFLSLSW